MIVDLRRTCLPPSLDVPLAVIGAGPAGIALALALEERGVPVLLLEAGSDRIERAGQDAYRAGEISPADHGPVHRFRHRVLGGTSRVWGGRCIPFDPIDVKTRDWIPHAEWPIAYDEVARHYPAALALCRAGRPAFTAAACWPGEHPGLVDLDHPDVVLHRIERFSEPTDFGKAYRARLAASRTVTVALNAPVARITAAARGREVTGVVVRTPGGGEVAVRAPRVVVAAGALETARLLLLSSDAKPCGLGNERDLVGRFYQSHLEGHVGELVVAPGARPRLDYARDGDGTYCRRYIWLAPAAQRRERLAGLIARPTHPKIADPGHGDPVLSAMFLVKDLLLPEYARGMSSTEAAGAAALGRSVARYGRHLRNVVLGSPRLVAFAADWARRRTFATRKLPSVVLIDRAGRYPLDVNAEQRPNRDSRVLLGRQLDAYGQRRLDIAWQATARDRDDVVRGMAVIARAFAGSREARILLPDAVAQAAALTRIGGHHLGTARMGRSAATGVVDGAGEAFDVAGLYVLGAAAFPTSGFANPTLTVVALALRMAEHLAATTRGRAPPARPRPAAAAAT